MGGKRREKGDGSIYQRESDGRFVAYAHLPDGKKKYVYDKTRSGVAKKLKELQRSIEQGTLITAKPENVEVYLLFWLEHKRIKGTTYSNYRSSILSVLPYIGSIKLAKLTSEDIQKAYDDLLKRQAPGTIRLTHRVLKTAFNDAVKKKKLNSNPCNGAEQPQETKEEATALTADQCMQLIDTAKGTPLDCFVVFALNTAMRRGELIALRWSDIDMDEKTVKIQRTASFLPDPVTKKYRYVETTPKSRESKRTIPLTDYALAALKAHKVKQIKMRLMSSSTWVDKDLVFCNSKGGYLQTAFIHKNFRKIVQQAGVPDICVHELRHSAATLLRRKGVDLKTIQRILGHSNYSITANIYEHVNMGDQQEAMDKMDDLFRKDS